MNCKKISKILFPLILSIILLPLTYAQAADNMQDYCLIPPFLAQSISPNVLIVLDNSGSMCGGAYASDDYDPSQFNDGQYYGYFDGVWGPDTALAGQTKYYQYTGNNRWEATTLPLTNGTAANPIAAGSFLNWATMRRIDVAKKLLIGGKADPRSWNGAVTVKLLGETACDRHNGLSKTFDTSAGDLIYPFVGNYQFAMDNSDNLSISPISGGSNTFYVRPGADISMPAGWSEFPTGGAVTAWDKVDETSSDGDSTYIENNNTTNPVILGFNYTQAEPAGVISVKVHVRARRTASGQTRRIRGVLNIDGTNYQSNTSRLGTSYSTYSFTWANNPVTSAPWTWDQIKKIAASDNLQGFGVMADQNYTSRYPRATQVYLSVTVTVPTGGPYNTIVDQGMVKAEGIIDTLTSDVRFGLAYYNYKNGGKVDTYVDFLTPTNMITSIHNKVPNTWTPLGETLYEMTRYFRQDAPYYSNSPADYSVAGGAANMYRDPYWYELSDIDSNYTDQYVPCAKSFILFLTDGESTQDQNIPGNSTSAPYAACSLTNIKACSGYGGAPNNPNPRFAGTSIGTTYSWYGTDYMIDVAYWARTNDMRPGACTTVPTSFQQCLPGTQNVILYPVFMFGVGSPLLKDAAIYGGFEDIDRDNKPDCSTIPSECYRDTDGDGVIESNGDDDPITYYEGNDGAALERSITNAINAILRRASSGTAASVLASGGEHGANMLQAVFYPERPFDSGSADWVGTLQNLWFYIDPQFTGASIREDTEQNSILHLKNDYVTRYFYDPSSQTTFADLFWDKNGNYSSLVYKDRVEIDDLKNLWEAGLRLWERDISPGASPRTIKTYIGEKSGGMPVLRDFDYTAANRTALRPYLQASSEAEAEAVIRYIHGEDTPFSPIIDINGDGTADVTPSYRSRTVGIDLSSPPDGDTLDAGEEPKVWKLGDIISSTPKVYSWVPASDYHLIYKDKTYERFICLDLKEPCASEYDQRGLVFTGANDGMLHAFKLGRLQLKLKPEGVMPPTPEWEPAKFEWARLVNPDTGQPCDPNDAERCGSEVWAFIPKHILPYLKYNADPDYCHLYNVDGMPHIFDASIGASASLERAANGTSWRTVLLGSMKQGGACRDANDVCPNGVNNCVKAPGVDLNGDGDTLDVVNGNDESKLGLSVYFALDITDINPANWKLLWEFSDENIPSGELADGGLGFSTSGAAIVRINSAACKDPGGKDVADKSKCNGEWFVAIPSGPTGKIDTATRQFMGRSDQKLKVFVIDLKTGEYKTAIKTFGGEINYAFGGNALNSTVDADRDYQDDALYFGYINSANNVDDNTWTNGGVIRILTKEDPDPANWSATKLMENVGAVTAAVAGMKDTIEDKLWLYFGTGRYFFKQFGVLDDAASQRRIYGIKDPCYLSAEENKDPGVSYNLACATKVSAASLDDVTDIDINDQPTEDDEGWSISLEAADSSFDAERVTTDPVASTTGVAFFTTFKPTADICGYGGSTHLWAVKHNTGGTATSLLRGKVLIQVSTGAIEEIELKTAFEEDSVTNPDSKDDRRSGALVGKSSDGPPLLLSSPPTFKKIIHMREK